MDFCTMIFGAVQRKIGFSFFCHKTPSQTGFWFFFDTPPSSTLSLSTFFRLLWTVWTQTGIFALSEMQVWTQLSGPYSFLSSSFLTTTSLEQHILHFNLAFGDMKPSPHIPYVRKKPLKGRELQEKGGVGGRLVVPFVTIRISCKWTEVFNFGRFTPFFFRFGFISISWWYFTEMICSQIKLRFAKIYLHYSALFLSLYRFIPTHSRNNIS